MDEALTPEQKALAEALGRVLGRPGHIGITRDFCCGDPASARALAKDFQAFGGPGIGIPESFGGSGLGSVEAALVARAIGRHASPLPFIAHALAAQALVRMGRDAHQQAWLAAIARGEARIAVSLRPDAEIAVDGGVLHGCVPFIADAPDCDALLLRDRDDGLHLVPRQPGMRWVELITVDRSRRFAELHLEAAQAQPLDADAHGLRALVGLERLLLAAENLGACESLLERALAHAQARHQFGRPIGSFQAIKHLCADMAAELDLARSLTWHAAARHAQDGGDAALSCAEAKAHMDEVARSLARGAIEVHGAMGFAEQSDLHFWSKRIAVNRTLAGAPQQLRRDIAAMRGWLV